METLSPVSPTSEERTWGMLTHFASVLGFFFPFGSLIGPLIAWSVKKHESTFVDENGKSAVNFNLTWTIVLAIFWITWLIMFLSKISYFIMRADSGALDSPEDIPVRFILNALGFMMPIVLIYLFKFVMMLIATIQSSNGTVFKYPLSYNFIK